MPCRPLDIIQTNRFCDTFVKYPARSQVWEIYQLIVIDSLDDDTRRSQDYLNVHVYGGSGNEDSTSSFCSERS